MSIKETITKKYSELKPWETFILIVKLKGNSIEVPIQKYNEWYCSIIDGSVFPEFRNAILEEIYTMPEYCGNTSNLKFADCMEVQVVAQGEVDKSAIKVNKYIASIIQKVKELETLLEDPYIDPLTKDALKDWLLALIPSPQLTRGAHYTYKGKEYSLIEGAPRVMMKHPVTREWVSAKAYHAEFGDTIFIREQLEFEERFTPRALPLTED